ncbi:MAG: GGDEF domain-containing protein [Fimbriimonas sp.]|nr:GGDEF domain-containing protein [Fimbriimonas sp.]
MSSYNPEPVNANALQNARLRMASDPGSAAKEFAQLARRYRDSGEIESALEARRYHCFSHIMNLEVEEADRIALIFLKEANEDGNARYLGIAQMYLGIISLETGEMGLACEFLEEALQTATEADDVDLISRVQMNLGNAFFNFERYEDAIRSFSYGLENLASGGGVSSISLGEYNVASAHTMLAHQLHRSGGAYQEHIAEARRHLRSALVRSEIEESTRVLCELLLIQLFTLETGIVNELEFASISEVAEKTGVDPVKIAVLETQCYCYEAAKDWESLYTYARRAISFVKRKGSIKTLDRLQIFAATGAAGVGEFDHAYELLSEALERIREVNASQTSRRAHILDTKFEVQKAKFDQQVLRMRNQFLVERNRELEVEVKMDRLSGVLNRRGAEEALSSLAAKNPGGFAIGLTDIDFFKRVNDTYGHGIGDQVIRTFAGILKCGNIGVIHVGRWGGEEFIMAFEATSESEVAAAAEQISEDIRSFDWSVIQPGLKVTASLGIAVHDQLQHVDKTVETADAFLYAAKQAGRDCWMYRPQRRAA